MSDCQPVCFYCTLPATKLFRYREAHVLRDAIDDPTAVPLCDECFNCTVLWRDNRVNCGKD